MTENTNLPTTTQTRALFAWVDLTKTLGTPAGDRVLSVQLGVSKPAAHKLLVELGERGMLRRVGEGWHERWEITELGKRWVRTTRPLLEPKPAAAAPKKAKKAKKKRGAR